MGYESELHLIDVKIRLSGLPGLLRTLKGGKSRRPARLGSYFDLLVVDEDGFLTFKASKDGLDPYVPDEEGTVPALLGKFLPLLHFSRSCRAETFVAHLPLWRNVRILPVCRFTLYGVWEIHWY